jgi:cytoskeletal protein CcmA (bactofilin family)
MMNTKKSWKPFIAVFCLLLTITLLFPSTALAQGITIEDTVAGGEVLDQNLILAGTTVAMDGVINGDLLAIGDKVTINGDVNGSLVAIGKTVTIDGQVSGSAYVAALKLTLGSQANVERDLTFVGGQLEMQEASAVGRDLKAISLEASLSGSVGNEVNALVGPLNLIQAIYKFMVDQGWLPETMQLDLRLLDGGIEKQTATVMTSGLPAIRNMLWMPFTASSQPAWLANTNLAADQQSTVDVEALQSWAIPTLRTLAALLIVGLLAVWLAPMQVGLAVEQLRIRPWRSLLTGLLVLIIGWIAALLLFLLILALTIFLYWISLPNLAFVVGTLGLSMLGVAVTIFWLSIVFFSKIIVAYLLGKLIFKRFLPKYAHARVWPLVTGVILYTLLASIPYLGWFIMVLTTLFGLGALWLAATTRRQPEALSPAQPEPVDDQAEMAVESSE